MNDKELADAVVALGIGADQCGYDYRWLEAGVIDSLPATQFVTDWRVTGVCMEKARHDSDMTWFWDSLNLVDEGMDWPRAIIEACVEALTND